MQMFSALVLVFSENTIESAEISRLLYELNRVTCKHAGQSEYTHHDKLKLLRVCRGTEYTHQEEFSRCSLVNFACCFMFVKQDVPSAVGSSTVRSLGEVISGRSFSHIV